MEEVLIILIVIVAGLVQGIFSFGSSLITLPLLPIFLDLKLEVIPIICLFNLVSNSINAYVYKKELKIKDYLPMIILGFVGAVIGATIILNYLNNWQLKFIVGIVITIASLTSIFNLHFKTSNSVFTKGYVGLGAGILSGSIGMGSPFISLFLTNLKIPKNQFKAITSMFFLLLNILTLIIYLNDNRYSIPLIQRGIYYNIFLTIALSFGIKISSKLSDQIFSKAVLCLTLLMGIYTILVK